MLAWLLPYLFINYSSIPLCATVASSTQFSLNAHRLFPASLVNF
jgi:hypothetical protein